MLVNTLVTTESVTFVQITIGGARSKRGKLCTLHALTKIQKPFQPPPKTSFYKHGTQNPLAVQKKMYGSVFCFKVPLPS